MNAFKIIFGIIVAALGLGLVAAGWAVAAYGGWMPIVNISFGFVLGFMGIGVVLAGSMLVHGSRVGDALGGIVAARSGQSGIGLHKGDTYHIPPNNIKDTLVAILKYTVIAICIILIVIFSMIRATGGLRNWVKL